MDKLRRQTVRPSAHESTVLQGLFQNGCTIVICTTDWQYILCSQMRTTEIGTVDSGNIRCAVGSVFCFDISSFHRLLLRTVLCKGQLCSNSLDSDYLS